MVTVISPAPPSSKFDSRPSALLQSLASVAPLEVDIQVSGRSGDRMQDLSRLGDLLRRDTTPGSSACLTPLHFFQQSHRGVWFDAYDDWTLAPDLSYAARTLASRGYRALRRGAGGNALVTVNSEYMRDKLFPRPSLVVPNGVSPELASQPGLGDEAARVLVMGKFFNGRTDWHLVSEILMARSVDEVVVIGNGARLPKLIRLAADCGRRITHLAPTPFQSLSPYIGPRTIFAIPHVVSDYTLSQDLMKAYQAIALGMPICVPNALWPPTIPRELGVAFERGVAVEDVLAGAIEWSRLSTSGRGEFAAAHSWSMRAALVAKVVGWS